MFRDIYGGICVLINNLIHRRGSPTQMMDSPQLITVLVGQRPEIKVCYQQQLGTKRNQAMAM